MTLYESIRAASEQKVWRFRIKDFLLLEESGAFADYARAELLDGEIWVLNAIHSPHAAAQGELQGQLWSALTRLGLNLRAYVTPSIEMGDNSLPEPDIVVTEPHGAGFLPFGKVKLVVEVSDTTLDVDLGRKQRVYAAAGIPEYWVADLNGRVIHQMWSPGEDKYFERRQIDFDHEITSATVEALLIQTSGL